MRKKSCITVVLALLAMILGIAMIQLYDYTKKNITGGESDPILFGATYMTLNNPFFEVIDNEMRNVIEANGDMMITMDPQLSLTRQIEQIHTMMKQGVDVLIVNPVDSKGLIDVLKEAKEKGIFIIAIDTNVYNGNDFVDYTIVSDNYEAGRLCATHMMSLKNAANIILLKHEAAYSAVERIQGFKDVIQEHPNYRIVEELECEGQLEKSMPLITQAIKKRVNFDVVMSLNDPSALGAVAALQEAGTLDQVLVYGVDGTPEAKVLVKKGFMEGTVAQYPKKMAKKAIASAYALLEGQTYLKEEIVDVDMIDVQNIDAFSLEGWQ